jgi:hypothetical protein
MPSAHFAGDAHIGIAVLVGPGRYRLSGGAQVEGVPDEIRFAGGPPQHAVVVKTPPAAVLIATVPRCI